MSKKRPGTSGTPGTLESLRIYARARTLSMLALGFSSGLPFMLIFSTLSAWLSQSGIRRATIGMFSWVSLVYTIKFVWSPVVDRLRLPLIGRALGQRRSWMLLAQVSIGAALLTISGSNPKADVLHVAMLALWLAFSAATQDIAIDAWRIESAPVREQGSMAAAYQLGYRIAILVGQAGALWIAEISGWARSYSSMAQLAADRHRHDAAGARARAHRTSRVSAYRTARDRLARASRGTGRAGCATRAPGSSAPSFARSSISSRASGRCSACCCLRS